LRTSELNHQLHSSTSLGNDSIKGGKQSLTMYFLATEKYVPRYKNCKFIVTELPFYIFVHNTTERFKDLCMLNLPMVVWF